MRYRFLLGLCCLLSMPAMAQATLETTRAWQLAQRGGVGLSQAADMVARSTGGRVLSAQTVQEGGREVHRIKVLTNNGEVRIVRVDAATGRME